MPIVDSAFIPDRDEDSVYLWTVYDHPRDYPHSFVARLWIIARGPPVIRITDTVIISPSLDYIRNHMRRAGFHRMARMAQDEPQILETWI